MNGRIHTNYKNSRIFSFKIHLSIPPILPVLPLRTSSMLSTLRSSLINQLLVTLYFTQGGKQSKNIPLPILLLRQAHNSLP